MKQLDTAIVNMKTEYGEMINKSALFYADLLGVIDLNEHQVTGLQRAMETIAKMEMDDLISGYQTLSGLYVEIEGQLENVNKLQSEMDGLGTSSNDRKRRTELIKELETENARLDMMRDVFTQFQNHEKALADANKNRKEQIHNVAFYTAKIKALTEEQELENTSLERNAQILKELIAAQKELDRLKGKEKKGKKFKDVVDDEMPMPPVGDDAILQASALGRILDEIYGDTGLEKMQAYRDRENDLATERLEQDRMDAEAREKLQSQYQDTAINTANTIASVVANIQQVSLNHEMQLLDNQLQNGIISREEYERKIGVLRTESARQSKEMSLFEATTSTAMAVMNALSDSTVPYYLAVINAGLAAALGAAEIAAIASTPIPQFAKGTKNAPAGFKWVGEEGPELIHDGGGYPIITHRESMKILEKYNIESVDIDSIQRGGFDGMAASSRLQGFNDSNMLFATDRLRSSNKDGFRMLAEAIIESNKPKRGGYA